MRKTSTKPPNPEAIHGSSGADVLLTPPLCERLGRFDRIVASEYIS